jgi:hypothetical protein
LAAEKNIKLTGNVFFKNENENLQINIQKSETNKNLSIA